MLSIPQNKENIATQILNQFDVDYDIFRTELGFVKTDTKAEYPEEESEEFEDEKKYAAKPKQGTGRGKSKTPVLDNFGRDITRMAEQGTLDLL